MQPPLPTGGRNFCLRNMTAKSKPPQEPQHSDDGNNNPRQAGADSDPADGLLLKGVETLAEPGELSLHPIPAVLTANDDFQGKEAAVEGGEAVADGFPAELAAIREFVKRVVHWPSDSFA